MMKERFISVCQTNRLLNTGESCFNRNKTNWKINFQINRDLY